MTLQGRSQEHWLVNPELQPSSALVPVSPGSLIATPEALQPPDHEAHLLADVFAKHELLVAPLLRSLLPQSLAALPSHASETSGFPDMANGLRAVSSEFLRLLVFSLSNNFAGLCASISPEQIWNYLRAGSLDAVFDFVTAHSGPTSIGLRLSLFKCATAAGDAKAIEYFLKAKNSDLRLSEVRY